MSIVGPVLGGLGLVVAASLCAPGQPPSAFDFTHDVLPLLQRHGCSSAYCHGSATGRAGFRLSLFGSDPAADHAAIATQFGGRRLDLRDPDRSLIVQKALGRLGHGGGRRFERDSAAHAKLLAWIAAGAPWRTGPRWQLADLRLAVRGERLVVEAAFRRAKSNSGEAEQLRDVSDVALFSTTDPTVVDVTADGQLTRHGAGQAHLLARLGNHTATVRIVHAFAASAGGDAVSPASGHAFDRAWSAHLDELQLSPDGSVAAERLARRLHLDLVGRPPTPQELDLFVAEPDIAATVARLAGRREFAEVWGEHLARWFELSPEPEAGPAAAAVRRGRTELVASLMQGDSLLAISRRIVLGDRDGVADERVSGLVDRFGDARDRAEYAGRTLLGMRIGCARCHDHPSDRWRRSQHQAFSACFAPPRPDGEGGTMAGAMFDVDSGERIEPRLLPLGSGVAAVPREANRRREVADFLLDGEHDAFARNACNRVFAIVFGRGLVEPVDDHRLGNPPLDAGMLDALVARFHDGGGHLRELLAFLLTSSAYRAEAAVHTGPRVTHLAARGSRPLLPAAFARALAAVVGRAPAVALPASDLARELALRNGPIVQGLLAAGGTTIDATFELCGTPDERLHELWRTVLSRSPRPEEVQRFLPYTRELSAFRDLAYGLLTSREFAHSR